MEKLRLSHIYKTYGGGEAVIQDLNLSIEDGEFVVLLGPSGCGKSTILRIIAGLEPIDKGDIYLNGKSITDASPKDRDMAMVFQNYALYPHMTVYENIAVSLELRHVKKSMIQDKVRQTAQMLDLTDLLDRKPAQLSGGQMQRVALARAIVRQPQLFLMDEPLSNLDAKLRVRTRSEIIKLHQQLKTTTIFVTHDQVEALTMATKIVLFNHGVIQQQGKPEELYDRPANLFTAGFIGSVPMNFLSLPLRSGQVDVLGRVVKTELPDQDVVAGIRPERIQLQDGTDFTVEFVENLGSDQVVHVRPVRGGTDSIQVKCPVERHWKPGDKASLSVEDQHVYLFDPQSGQRLYPA